MAVGHCDTVTGVLGLRVGMGPRFPKPWAQGSKLDNKSVGYNKLDKSDKLNITNQLDTLEKRDQLHNSGKPDKSDKR